KNYNLKIVYCNIYKIDMEKSSFKLSKVDFLIFTELLNDYTFKYKFTLHGIIFVGKEITFLFKLINDNLFIKDYNNYVEDLFNNYLKLKINLNNKNNNIEL